MQFSLKDLHRLDQRIFEIIGELIGRANSKVSMTLSAYDTDIAGSIAKQKAQVLSDAQDARELIVIRYLIRKLVKQANQAEIDDLLNRHAKLSSEMEVLVQVFENATKRGGFDVYQTLEDATLAPIVAKFQAVVANQASAVAQEDRATIACILPQAEIDQNRAVIARIKREIETIMDRVGTLNMTTKANLSLSEPQLKLLKKYNVYGAEG